MRIFKSLEPLHQGLEAVSAFHLLVRPTIQTDTFPKRDVLVQAVYLLLCVNSIQRAEPSNLTLLS
jgi:hypothetical protein